MTAVETVRRFLKGSPGEALCDGCLALACEMALTEMRQISKTLRAHAPDMVVVPLCGSCRRDLPAIAYLLKCAHCTRSIEPPSGDPGMLIDGEAFHLICLQRLVSEEQLRVSNVISPRSRTVIEQARRPIDGGT